MTSVFRNTETSEEFDFWFELEIGGVPAGDRIKGCEDRTDLFDGTVRLIPDSAGEKINQTQLASLAFRDQVNNYQEGKTDKIGKTKKTYGFTLNREVGARFELTVSQHGANPGGEEYNRRDHFVYLDGELVLKFKPGRKSCEPFRKYNTRPNGIYGKKPKTDEGWQRFSNWCPGDVIDTRVFNKRLSSGRHRVVLEVPDAEFKNEQGLLHVSLAVRVPKGAM